MEKEFFRLKLKEMKGLLEIMVGKILKLDQERERGVRDALSALEGERRYYENQLPKKPGPDTTTEIEYANRPHMQGAFEDRVERESGRDISAI